MITIDQLLESVDLDFEPRWVTKDEYYGVILWEEEPQKNLAHTGWVHLSARRLKFGPIKISDFENKPWQECIYEVPRKTTGMVKKFVIENDRCGNVEWWDVVKKINELVDAVNELKAITQLPKLKQGADLAEMLSSKVIHSSILTAGE